MSMIKIKNILPKAKLTEFVDTDGGVISGDRNVSNNSEIETGPIEKPFNDDSDYEKGVSTTTDRASRYRQNIPWFAVYSAHGTSGRGIPVNENKKNIITKKELEEDLVKKSKKDNEIFNKDYDNKTEKVLDIINDVDLTDNQLLKIKKAILDKIKDNG